MFDNYRENYATSKLKELKNAELESVMNLKFQFKIGDSFVQESFANSENNDALQNMVQPFLFSSLAKEGEGKKTKLILDDGYGNYVPTLDKEGFLFIPYPVLEKAEKIPFFKSLTDYFDAKEVKEKGGKNLEICVCNALNFYVKNCENIKLADICNLHGKISNGGDEVFSWKLEKISRVPDIKLSGFCPSVVRKDTQDYIDFDKLPGLSPGFYHPTEKYNNTADIIGILNVENTNKTQVKRLILFIQLKDWFKDTLSEKVYGEKYTKNIVDEWRWSQQFVTESDVYLKRDDEEKSMVNQFSAYWKEHKVFLIFSANKIESISTGGAFSNVKFHRTTQYKEKYLRENEGTMNLEHSKNWFPTFGYNLQIAQTLSQNV